MKRIGIVGGTFDPPHIGHLLIGEEVRIALQLEEVWFIPTYEPPHKRGVKSNAIFRVEMLQMAISTNPAFHINSIELERQGKSYTYDTMKLLIDKHLETEFYFIIGADMVENLPNWYKIDELLKMVTFVGVQRPGYQIKSPYSIKTVAIPLIDISSTLIRKRLQLNQSIKYLVPDAVEAFIKEKRLYAD